MVFHSQVYADCGNDSNGNGNNYDVRSAAQNCPPTVNNLEGITVAVIEAMVGIAAIVFFFMILINGFNFITAMGNPDKLEGARKGLLYTVIGFALIFTAFIIMNIISNVTGLKSGFSVDSHGNIQFNIISQYNPN